MSTAALALDEDNSPQQFDDRDTRQWDHRSTLVLCGVVVLGVVLRLREFLNHRSLWRDEASLVFNLRHRDALGFTRPLDHDQGAPAGFFVMTRGLGDLFGESELGYRLLPFVASCAVLAFAAILGRRWLNPVAAITAVALLAFSWTLIYYSAEVKQYGVDVAIWLGMLLVADEARRRSWSPGACFVLGFFGALALLSSHPAVFSLPVIGGLAGMSARHDPRALHRLAAVGGSWMLVVIGSYVAWTQNLNENDFLTNFWAAGFLPIPPRSLDHLRQWARAGESLYSQVFPADAVILGVLLSGVGAVRLFRQHRTVAVAIFMPIVLVVLASSLLLYPAIERAILFLVPAVAVSIGVGTEALGEWMADRWRILWAVPSLIVVILASGPAMTNFAQPEELEELRPLLTALGPELDGSTVLVTETAEAAWDYYSDRLGLEPHRVVIVDFPRHDADGAAAVVRSLEGTGALWVVDVAFWERFDVIDPAVREPLDDIGVLVAAYHDAGASIYLYDLSEHR